MLYIGRWCVSSSVGEFVLFLFFVDSFHLSARTVWPDFDWLHQFTQNRLRIGPPNNDRPNHRSTTPIHYTTLSYPYIGLVKLSTLPMWSTPPFSSHSSSLMSASGPAVFQLRKGENQPSNYTRNTIKLCANMSTHTRTFILLFLLLCLIPFGVGQNTCKYCFITFAPDLHPCDGRILKLPSSHIRH